MPWPVIKQADIFKKATIDLADSPEYKILYNHIIRIVQNTEIIQDYLNNIPASQLATITGNNPDTALTRLNNMIGFGREMVVLMGQRPQDYARIKERLQQYHTELNAIKPPLPPAWKQSGQAINLIEDSIAYLEQKLPVNA